MGVKIGVITIDCDDVQAVSQFWSAVLDLPIDAEPSEFFASINREGTELPRMFFVKVPETKTVKNRVHLDLQTVNNTADAEVERLISLGANKIAEKDEWGHKWAVFTDVEGNEFCLSLINEG